MPGKGLHEVRTRVLCHLPVNSASEEKAFFRVLEYLNDLRHQGVGVAGYTHSELRPAVFHGYWWPPDADEPVHDRIVMCMIDYLLAPGSAELSAKVAELMQTVRKCYRRYKSRQDEVWLVVHPVVRQD